MVELNAVNIVGAGLSGLSAAYTLAKAGIKSNLISSQPSERAQSVLAEGGINAALDTMGEHDTTEEHFADTMRGGCFLASEDAVKNLTDHAPEIVRELVRLGVPFRSEGGRLILRNFGGQKKKRTAYAKSSTGKMIMTALIDAVRKYEAAGLVRRFPHHELSGIRISAGVLEAIVVKDLYRGVFLPFSGPAILCTGGLNGFFEGMTTGTTQNNGNAAAIAFGAGVAFSNLEFLQYHPTTAQISGKRMLISEAARGEGGRLFTLRKGKPWYFMEDKYPSLGNLMPRDVISREMALLSQEQGCSGEVFLDLTGLGEAVWSGKLSDLRDEIMTYLRIDPKTAPVPVRPGIHFFMGGVWVNDRHETNISGLFAAGEAACKYHGANRLGGNSMLGAMFGGQIAALTAAGAANPDKPATAACAAVDGEDSSDSSPAQRRRLRDALLGGLGIVRTPEGMAEAQERVTALLYTEGLSEIDRHRARLGLAMLNSAAARKESRGAHYRTDIPDPVEAYRKQTRAWLEGGEIRIAFAPAAAPWEGARP